MAIVATDTGGLIPCGDGPLSVDGQPAVQELTYGQVDQIRDRFTALNPYDQAAVPGTILKAEVDAFCYAIAAKQYALFRYDQYRLPRLVDPGEHATCRHGLGHLLNPIDPDDDPDGQDWIVQLWEYELALALTPKLAGAPPDLPPACPPAWYGRPALSRIAATSPRLLGVFEQLNARQPYAKQVKPFNFLLFAPGVQAPAGLTEKIRLVAPRTAQRRWNQLRWINLHHPDGIYRLSTDPADPDSALQHTYATTAGRYLTHPERKSGQHGQPCVPHTGGLLERRTLLAGPHAYLGKEANRLEAREGGQSTVEELEQHQVIYNADTDEQRWTNDVVERLRRVGPDRLLEQTTISPRRLQDILLERAVPRAARRSTLLMTVRQAEADEQDAWKDAN